MTGKKDIRVRIVSIVFALLSLLASPVIAQTNINLGGVQADTSAPVEVTADNLLVDQDTGTATFSGNVLIGQGDLRLSAEKVDVIYNEGTGQISRLVAAGAITFVTATEAAEAENAVYDIEAGNLTLSGNVLLTQGPSAIGAERMVINLNTGSAEMSGRVRTVLQQGSN